MSLGRRGFLKVLGGGGAAAVAGAALPGCAPVDQPAPSVSIPAPTADGRLVFARSAFRDLDHAGGAVIANSPGQDPILVMRIAGDGMAAVSATCTHQGCPLGFEAPEVVCPCHQSHFTTEGRVVRGPARADLKQYAIAYDPLSGDVTITLATFPPLVAGTVTLPFDRFPELAAPGGSVVGRPAGYPDDVLVMALAGGGHAALDARCPHQGCTVGFPAAGGGQVICPCHGSRFRADGTLVQGPATVGLTPFTATADASGVIVTIPG
jgi:Rieske Fe-S protein